MIPVRGSLFAFRLTGFFPGHLNHMSNKLEKGGFQQSMLNGLLGAWKFKLAIKKDKRDTIYVLA